MVNTKVIRHHVPTSQRVSESASTVALFCHASVPNHKVCCERRGSAATVFRAFHVQQYGDSYVGNQHVCTLSQLPLFALADRVQAAAELISPALLSRARNIALEHKTLTEKLSNGFDAKSAKKLGEYGSIVNALEKWDKANEVCEPQNYVRIWLLIRAKVCYRAHFADTRLNNRRRAPRACSGRPWRDAYRACRRFPESYHLPRTSPSVRTPTMSD